MNKAQEFRLRSIPGPMPRDIDLTTVSQRERLDVDRIGSGVFAAFHGATVDVAASVSSGVVHLCDSVAENARSLSLYHVYHPETQSRCHLASKLVDGKTCPAHRYDPNAVPPTATVAGRDISNWDSRDMRWDDDGNAERAIVPNFRKTPIEKPRVWHGEIDGPQDRGPLNGRELPQCEPRNDHG